MAPRAAATATLDGAGAGGTARRSRVRASTPSWPPGCGRCDARRAALARGGRPLLVGARDDAGSPRRPARRQPRKRRARAVRRPGGGAYEIHGEPGPLIALLEGRTPLIDEAFARRIYIRGSFPDISVRHRRRPAGAARRPLDRCLTALSSRRGSPTTRSRSVRLVAVNHDGIALGKYLSAAKFLGASPSAAPSSPTPPSASTSPATSPSAGTGARGAARSSTSPSSPTSAPWSPTRRLPGWPR